MKLFNRRYKNPRAGGSLNGVVIFYDIFVLISYSKYALKFPKRVSLIWKRKTRLWGGLEAGGNDGEPENATITVFCYYVKTGKAHGLVFIPVFGVKWASLLPRPFVSEWVFT